MGILLHSNMKLSFKFALNRNRKQGVIMKRIFLLAALIISVLFIVTGCKKEESNSDKLSIVTTLFPQYDFARQIAKDKADIKLLLKPGTESHDYDPTPTDIISINKADVFIYTGENMEVWAHDIIESIDNDNLNILDVSKGIELTKSEEEHEEEEHAHDHEYDPHIWTSPKNAIVMINNILDILIKVDPDNKSFYEKNAKEYIKKIESIDSEIKDVVENSEYDTIYFGGRFALLYFVKEYNLKYISAFDSCSSETEPSAKLVTDIINEMKKNGAKTVFYEELTDPKAAKSIAEEIDGDTLLLHSCHNLSSKDFENGESYVSIMEKNIVNLKKGLLYKK